MSWYQTYYIQSNLDPKEINKYKDFFIESEEEEIDDLEKEYTESLNKVNNLYEKEDLIEYLKKFNSLNLLQEELQIIKLLAKYTLQNNYLDFSFFMKCIKLLINISSILMNRLNQTDVSHKTKNYSNYIPRCSYKFCNFKEECFYNYNPKTKNICYQDHYVHNMVNADLVILRDYINVKFKDSKLVIPNKEILKTINTLCYVIEHMYNELKSRCLYLKDNEIEKQHKVKKN
tara:strand:+ start:540 stop:1232 length:693 start_codon:yes stop_codon:yes gene_type:complete